jgi:glucose-6-phosphate 1-epimerase
MSSSRSPAAFASSAAVLPRGGGLFAQRCCDARTGGILGVAPQYGRVRMQESVDFEEIAKKLAADLSSQGISGPKLFDDGGKESFSPGVGPIEITEGNGGMAKVMLRHADSAQELEIYTYGAAVTSWKTRGIDALWVSDENKWQPGGKAIRGGIPLCFPQFGPYGDLVQHGFARVSEWMIEDTYVSTDGSVTAIFVLSSDKPNDATAAWPYKFSAKYTVTLSVIGLETNFQVTNMDDKPFDVTMAFHNYFKTSDVNDARIFGFEGLNFLNRLDGDKEQGPEDDTGAGILLEKETDRIYLNAPEELAIFDFATLKIVKIKKTGTLPETTLWNPFGAEGADPGWQKFICVEPACVAKPATVAPGDTWIASQLLGVE